MKAVAESIVAVWGPPLQALYNLFTEKVGGVGDKVATVFGFIVKVFTSFGVFLVDVAGRYGSILSNIGEMIAGVFTLDIDRIKSGFSGVMSAATEGWEQTVDDITKNLQSKRDQLEKDLDTFELIDTEDKRKSLYI